MINDRLEKMRMHLPVFRNKTYLTLFIVCRRRAIILYDFMAFFKYTKRLFKHNIDARAHTYAH